MADEMKKEPAEVVPAEKANNAVTKKQPAKKPVKKKENKFFRAIAKFFRDYKSELKKIVWCSKKQLLNNTWVVLVCMVVVAAVTGALDFGFSKLLNWIAGLIG